MIKIAHISIAQKHLPQGGKLGNATPTVQTLLTLYRMPSCHTEPLFNTIVFFLFRGWIGQSMLTSERDHKAEMARCHGW